MDKTKDLESIKYPSKNHCSICEKIDPPVDIKCNKYCKRQYHSKCLIGENKDVKSILEGEYQWICDDCKQDKSECFACKKMGSVLPH